MSKHFAKFLGRIVTFSASLSMPPSHHNLAFTSPFYWTFPQKVLQGLLCEQYRSLWSWLLQHLNCLITCGDCAVLDAEPASQLPASSSSVSPFIWLGAEMSMAPKCQYLAFLSLLALDTLLLSFRTSIPWWHSIIYPPLFWSLWD